MEIGNQSSTFRKQYYLTEYNYFYFKKLLLNRLTTAYTMIKSYRKLEIRKYN